MTWSCFSVRWDGFVGKLVYNNDNPGREELAGTGVCVLWLEKDFLFS